MVDVATGSGLGAPGFWARTDLRRRWRSLVVLGVLAGITAGLAMASVAGARRTATAFPRLSERTLAADAVVFPSQVGAYQPDWAPLEAKPYITELAVWNLSFGALDDEPVLLFIPSDDRWLGDVDRPVVVEGRPFDRTAADEMVVDENLAKAEGVEVGDTFAFTPFAPDQSDLEDAPPSGPTIPLRVVGVIRFTSQFLFNEGGSGIPSPGVIDRYGDRMALAENAHVRLRDPSANAALLQGDVSEVLAPGTPVLDLHAVERRVATSIRVEELALLFLAAAVALAGLVFVGQALSRSVAAVDDDRQALSALGLSRAGLTAGAVLPHVLVAMVAAAVSALTAVALSPRFPVGFAGRVDPTRGVHADWLVLAPGVALTATVVLAGAGGLAWRRARAPRPDTPGRPPGFLARWRRLAPLPVGIGATSAFEPGRGRERIPVRPALVGAVAGVLGIAGTFTIDHGLRDALAHPERVGVTWQALVHPLEEDASAGGISPELISLVGDQPDVVEVTQMRRAVLDVNGAGVPTFALEKKRGDIDLLPVSGRAPRAEGEAAIGPATAAQLGVEVGDTVVVGAEGRPVRIVGEALFPPDVHSGFTEGLWVTPPALAGSARPAGDEASELALALRWRDGTDPDAALTRLTEAVGDRVLEVSAAVIPPELTNLRNVGSLPVFLAVFLTGLAVSSLAHVLAASLRRRRHQFAVLRALGFTRPMTGAVVSSHSTAVGLVGLALGIPLGLTVGSLGWTWVAERVPLRYVSPVTLGLLIVLVPAAVALANVIAAVPGWKAGRLQPAQVLRTE